MAHILIDRQNWVPEVPILRPGIALTSARLRSRLQMSIRAKSHSARKTEPVGGLRKRRLLQRSSTCRKAPHFALHKGIAIGFLKATGFRNKPKRTIFDVWCGDP